MCNKFLSSRPVGRRLEARLGLAGPVRQEEGSSYQLEFVAKWSLGYCNDGQLEMYMYSTSQKPPQSINLKRLNHNWLVDAGGWGGGSALAVGIALLMSVDCLANTEETVGLKKITNK